MNAQEINKAIAIECFAAFKREHGFTPHQRTDSETLYGGGCSKGLWIYKRADGHFYGMNYDTEQQLERGELESFAKRRNYFEDLNAIHEAWQMPPPPPFTDSFGWNCELGWQLEIVVKRDFDAKPKWHDGDFSKFEHQIFSAKDYILANATAPQRCEAFQRTVNPERAKEIYKC